MALANGLLYTLLRLLFALAFVCVILTIFGVVLLLFSSSWIKWCQEYETFICTGTRRKTFNPKINDKQYTEGMTLTDNGDYVCHKCLFRSKSKLNVDAHIALRHEKKAPETTYCTNYACSECSFEADRKSSLIAHMHEKHLIYRIKK